MRAAGAGIAAVFSQMNGGTVLHGRTCGCIRRSYGTRRAVWAKISGSENGLAGKRLPIHDISSGLYLDMR